MIAAMRVACFGVACVLVTAGVGGCLLPRKETVGPFVENIDVDDHVLVIRSCRIVTVDQTIDTSDCSTQRLPLPVTVKTPALTAADVDARIPRSARDAVAACGERFHLRDPVTVHIETNAAGRMIAVVPHAGDLDFRDCVGQALGTARLPPQARGLAAEISFALHPEPPRTP